jgi:hypothetical protein
VGTAWEAVVLPLNYARELCDFNNLLLARIIQSLFSLLNPAYRQGNVAHHGIIVPSVGEGLNTRLSTVAQRNPHDPPTSAVCAVERRRHPA